MLLRKALQSEEAKFWTVMGILLICTIGIMAYGTHHSQLVGDGDRIKHRATSGLPDPSDMSDPMNLVNPISSINQAKKLSSPPAVHK